MIHVCYGLHDKSGRYSKFTGTSILSIFENTAASVIVHILHDETLTQDNREKFIYIAGKYNQRVIFHNVEKICATQIQLLRDKFDAAIKSRFSIGAFYRLLLKEINLQDTAKILYLDSDTIINLDIRELWNCNLGNYALAATPEIVATRNHMIQDKFLLESGKVSAKNYFCSGVILMNLDRIGADFFKTSIDWLAENPQCDCFDQDILNNFFADNYLKLAEKFDSFVVIARALDKNIGRKIYHYAGKNIGCDAENLFDRLFFDYFTKTPWFDMKTIQHAYETLRFLYVDRQNFAARVTAMMAGKERAFFAAAPEELEILKSAFKIKADEEIISEKPKLIDAMKKSLGKKMFFLLAENLPEIRAELLREKFVEGRDFLDAAAFLSDANGLPLSPYSLISFL